LHGFGHNGWRITGTLRELQLADVELCPQGEFGPEKIDQRPVEQQASFGGDGSQRRFQLTQVFLHRKALDPVDHEWLPPPVKQQRFALGIIRRETPLIDKGLGGQAAGRDREVIRIGGPGDGHMDAPRKRQATGALHRSGR